MLRVLPPVSLYLRPYAAVVYVTKADQSIFYVFSLNQATLDPSPAKQTLLLTFKYRSILNSSNFAHFAAANLSGTITK